ncbi:NADH-quinone oxidoreductase subunit C [Bacillota bacterium LX-D]|nr:NADH-quinone oxidoreductase subunit C [Bacillota bacterium LX-D]
MTQEQKIVKIKVDEIKERVQALSKEGYKFVQMNCSLFNDEFEINYSFEDEQLNFINLRLNISQDVEIPSISDIFWAAFLYENEMHDLFGVKVKDISLDFKGELYKTAIKTPFNVTDCKKEE